MTKIFFAEDMRGTPFLKQSRHRLGLPKDVVIVDSAHEADIIVARYHYILADYFHLSRKYYLWTHEPPWCQATEKEFTNPSGEHIYVSSAWNGDIYTDPLYYFLFTPPRMSSDDLRALVVAKSKPCVLVASYRRKFDRYVGTTNVDLCEYRQRIAIELQKRYEFCDIFGKNWPESVQISGESRNAPGNSWHDAKLEILKNYAFNLCMENTLIENYVTEKIWDAYRSACVPVYFGRGSGIYAVLRKGSFIDCSQTTSSSELYDQLSSMSVDQRLEILQNAFDDIDKVRSSSSKDEVVASVVERFVDRIRQM